MDEQGNETWLCSIVCIGILSDQAPDAVSRRAIHSRLRTLAHAVATAAPSGEHVVADMNDGIVLCLAGDPGRALSAARSLHDRLRGQAGDASESVRYRIGVHLASVQLVQNADGRRHPAGEGLTIAQRVMQFAAPEQLVVSRAFQQVATRLSPDQAQNFRSLGQRHDEHAREYLLYEIAGAERSANEPAGARLAQGPSTQTVAFHTGWDTAELAAAALALRPYVGDHARVVVQQAAERATSVNHFYHLLARSIPTSADREAFCRAHGVASATDPPKGGS